MIHRLIDGGKEESYAGRLSRAGDEGDQDDKNVAKMHNEWYRTPSLETDEGGKIKTPELLARAKVKELLYDTK